MLLRRGYNRAVPAFALAVFLALVGGEALAQANAAPTVSIQENSQTVRGDAVVQLTGTVQDDSDAVDALTIAWTASPDLGTFANPASASTTWTAPPSTDTSQAVTLTLTATDTGTLSASDNVVITVRTAPTPASTPPEIWVWPDRFPDYSNPQDRTRYIHLKGIDPAEYQSCMINLAGILNDPDGAVTGSNLIAQNLTLGQFPYSYSQDSEQTRTFQTSEVECSDSLNTIFSFPDSNRVTVSWRLAQDKPLMDLAGQAEKTPGGKYGVMTITPVGVGVVVGVTAGPLFGAFAFAIMFVVLGLLLGLSPFVWVIAGMAAVGALVAGMMLTGRW